MRHLLFLFLALLTYQLQAQDYFPDNTAIKSSMDLPVAFVGGTVHVNSVQSIEKGTLLIHKDKIIAVGREVDIPANARIVDASGQHLYPSFIDLYTDFGISGIPKAERSGQPQYDPKRKGYYWNDHIRPSQKASDFFDFDEKKAKKLRSQGFGTVQTHVEDGVIRGTGMVVGLHDNASSILHSRSAQFLGFSRSQQSRQAYPNSIMGYTALLRQVYHDLDAYEGGLIDRQDLSLEALKETKKLPQFFEAKSLLNVLRAAKIAAQTQQEFIFVTGGDEYQRIEELQKINAKCIVPLDFPDAYDVENPFLADHLSLAEMKHWEHAPFNPIWLQQEKIDFALSTTQLDKPEQFLSQLQKSIDRGLSREVALEALTTRPALWLGMENELGQLKKGFRANFFMTNKPLFTEKSTISEHWILGHAYRFSERHPLDFSGKYLMQSTRDTLSLSLTKKGSKYSGKLLRDSTKLPLEIQYENPWLFLTYRSRDSSDAPLLRARIQLREVDTLYGSIYGEADQPMSFSLKKQAEETPSEDEQEDENPKADSSQLEIGPIVFPNMAYGRESASHKKGSVLIKGGTIITGEEQGNLAKTDLLVVDGIIQKIGPNLKAKGVPILDANGKFVSAGIVDEHSHIAGTSINESGQNSSAQVRMADAVNPNDIHIYRALAGGVTSIQLLHGSANPIGGQSAILKLKWGCTADEMLYENMPKFIKFALGENVKQSNWGGSSRFPQSRMGVEQIFVDYFTRAVAYGQKKRSGEPYRIDEELETLLEIVESERFISCHSYVQSEINMLMKVAEQFGFVVNTFTHILEGYKVADKMVEHGAGGSSFSDWWAYKFEVKDAIPYNAAIMHKQGVTVAINSDDSEMMRRLNQEAAKSMKYGGLTEEEVWPFVTLNPAKLLHIDDRVGSLAEGKDGDIVIWNDHPLSVYAVPEKTLIEGTVYFDRETDREIRKQIHQERERLIEKMITAKNKGLKVQPIEPEEKRHFCCETLDHY